jgi:hypothetical protein
MKDYISLTEAAASTGKSEMTIRRLSKKIIAKEHVINRNGVIFIDIDFVKSIYPHDNKDVISDNSGSEEADTLVNQISILKIKLEGKEELLKSQQQYIELLEGQFKEYQNEKQKELDRLHDRWSQEQEIFKRDQHLNAGKYIIQKNKGIPESNEQEASKSIWKLLFG